MEQAITLYLQVRQGYHPDLQTVAKACLAFDAAIKAAVSSANPMGEFRIEIESGDEGSLKLNSIIRSIYSTVTDKHFLISAASTVAIWFFQDTRSYMTEQMIEEIISSESDEPLSPDEVAEIAAAVVRQMRNETGESAVRQVFRELQADEMVEGVGVTLTPHSPPQVIVPRAQFEQRSNPPAVLEEEERSRTTVSRQLVILVSPVLLQGDRRWKFKGRFGEFGAPMRDEAFLGRVLGGSELLAMRGGITMDVDIETREVFDNGVWQPRERSILKVYGTDAGSIQQNLFQSPPSQDESDDGS